MRGSQLEQGVPTQTNSEGKLVKGRRERNAERKSRETGSRPLGGDIPLGVAVAARGAAMLYGALDVLRLRQVWPVIVYNITRPPLSVRAPSVGHTKCQSCGFHAMMIRQISLWIVRYGLFYEGNEFKVITRARRETIRSIVLCFSRG